MNTQAMPSSVTSESAARASSTHQTFDHLMLGLAGVLFIIVASAASILITLPEALDAVSSPAMGAPWMTVSAPEAAPARQAKNSARWSCGGH